MSERFENIPQVLIKYTVGTSVELLNHLETAGYADECMRWVVVANACADLIKALKRLNPAIKVEAIQINSQQLIHFSNNDYNRPQILSAADLERFESVCLTTANINEFGLELELAPFDLKLLVS